MQVRSTDGAGSGLVRRWIAALLVVATILFVIGVTVERGTESREAAPPPTATSLASPVAGEAQPAEGSAAGEAAEKAPAPVAAAATAGEGAESTLAREQVLGVDLENPAVIAAIVVGWGVLLGALFLLGRNGLLLVALAAGAATLFDLAEVVRQLGRANGLVTLLALAVLLAHVALFGLVLWALLRARRLPVTAPA